MGQSTGHVAATGVPDQSAAPSKTAGHRTGSHPSGAVDSDELVVDFTAIGLSSAPSTTGSLEITRPNGGYSAAGCPQRVASFASSHHSFSTGLDASINPMTVTTPQVHLVDPRGDANLWVQPPSSSSSASIPGTELRATHATAASLHGHSNRYDRFEGFERPKLSFNDNVESYGAESDDGYGDAAPNSGRSSQYAHSATGAYGSNLHPLYEDLDVTAYRHADRQHDNLSGLGPRAYALPESASEGDIDNTWDSVPSTYSSLRNVAPPMMAAYPPPYRESSPAAASSCSAAAVEARQRQAWQVGSILEVFSSTSAVWNVARVMQVREGEDADVLTVKFYVQDGPKQKLLLRSDPQLALLGRNTGGKLPAGFKIKPSQSHPGEAVYFDATTGHKYASLEMAWQTHFERLMLQPAEAIQTVKALAPMQGSMPVVAPAPAADGAKKWMTVQEMQNLKRGPQRQPQDLPPDPLHANKVALPEFDERGQAISRVSSGHAAMPQPSLAAPYPLLQAQPRPPPYPMVANQWQGAQVR